MFSFPLACPADFPFCAGLTSSLPPPRRLPSFLSPFPSSTRICHSHSSSRFISPTVTVCLSVHPCLQCHKPLGRSHSLLPHLLASSPISLYQHFHLFYAVVFPSPCLCLTASPVSPPSFIRESISARNSLHPKVLREPAQGDFMVKSMPGVQS